MGMKALLLVALMFGIAGSGISCRSSCGTETGNPQCPTSNAPEDITSYSNDDFGVTGRYDSTWTSEESPATSGGETASDGAADAPASAPASGIDTSSSPSTEFTDGTTTVTLFYVTLDEEPSSLLAYLRETFPGRSFEVFENEFVSGFTYDNPEAGTTGGDRQEYYFLDKTLLLYVVTDLFEASNGIANFETLIDSLQFE